MLLKEFYAQCGNNILVVNPCINKNVIHIVLNIDKVHYCFPLTVVTDPRLSLAPRGGDTRNTAPTVHTLFMLCRKPIKMNMSTPG